MARTSNQKNGKLEEAIEALVHAQVILVQNQAAFQAQIIDVQRQNTERFERIEALLREQSRILAEHSRILADHSRILAEHGQILQAIPDAVRDKIGFKAP